MKFSEFPHEWKDIVFVSSYLIDAISEKNIFAPYHLRPSVLKAWVGNAAVRAVSLWESTPEHERESVFPRHVDGDCDESECVPYFTLTKHDYPFLARNLRIPVEHGYGRPWIVRRIMCASGENEKFPIHSSILWNREDALRLASAETKECDTYPKTSLEYALLSRLMKMGEDEELVMKEKRKQFSFFTRKIGSEESFGDGVNVSVFRKHRA